MSDIHDRCRANGIGMAVSNPQFELWLLLHYDKGNGANTKRKCLEKLDHYIPGFSERKKYIPRDLPSKAAIAIANAKEKDCPPTRDWPRTTGTTVYRLVEKILN